MSVSSVPAEVRRGIGRMPWRARLGRLLIHVGERLGQRGDQQAAAEILGDTEEPDKRRQEVLQLVKQAMEAPTPTQFIEFLEFTRRFRRLSVWNARMAYIQRPGASVVASEVEWLAQGRRVKPDAVPILILWPFGPIAIVYELVDTLPEIDRAAFKDPFAVDGHVPPKVFATLDRELKKARNFHIKIDYRRLGYNLAGQATSHGTAPLVFTELPLPQGATIGNLSHAKPDAKFIEQTKTGPHYQITLNDGLKPMEAFTTLAHELGHIFCGHLGACAGKSDRDDNQSGWPDRRHLGKAEREIEAEAVAYLVAGRAGLVTCSADYLNPYVKEVEMSCIDVDLVVRAAARIERLAGLHYGSMAFR
jgi:hypothetical protein